MSIQDLLTEIDQLSLEEQLVLLEALSVRASRVSHVRGILRPEGGVPTDDELQQDYLNYLEEKCR